MIATTPSVSATNTLFKTRYLKECQRVNRFMNWLMVAQWFVGIAFAVFYSPLTWIGQEAQVHVHVWAAILLGGTISGTAILWTRLYPEATHTRHVIAISQMLWSALLIHLSGGRIETHFHVFASLAILSIYRDWKILITATAVVAVDHFVRGVYYPLSAFGVITESPYRWIEHAAWVLFEVAFLGPGCMRLRNEIRELCVRQTQIQEAKDQIETKVEERTAELVVANEQLAEKTQEAQKLALVARYTDNAVVITDGQGRIEWVNVGFTHITGISLEDVAGQSFQDFRRGPDFQPNPYPQICEAFENQAGFDDEFQNFRQDGSSYWLSIEMRPILRDDQSVHRFIVILSDISQRKSIELSLAAAEHRIRSLVDNVPGAFFRYRPSRNGEFLFMSKAIEDVVGYRSEEFVELRSVEYADIIHPEDKERIADTVNKAVAEGGDYEVEYRIIDRDHHIKWVWERGNCLADDQGNQILDGMLFDITDRVNAEAKSAQLQHELIDASRKAGMADVATGVLHNVGNVLNSVNVSASVIQRRFETSAITRLERVSDLISENASSFADFIQNDERGPKLPGFIQKITSALTQERQQTTQEFADLLKNVEHIKEIVAVQQSMAKSTGVQQQIEIKDIIHDVLTATKGSLINHDITILQEVDDAISPIVSDKHKILQILINLVKNAKDALVEDNIEDPTIQIQAGIEGESIYIRVIDNGVGIQPEFADKVFQHGYTTKADGHGFGLHSCANAATELGGTLQIVNFDEPGASLELTIPMQSGGTSRELQTT